MKLSNPFSQYYIYANLSAHSDIAAFDPTIPFYDDRYSLFRNYSVNGADIVTFTGPNNIGVISVRGSVTPYPYSSEVFEDWAVNNLAIGITGSANPNDHPIKYGSPFKILSSLISHAQARILQPQTDVLGMAIADLKANGIQDIDVIGYSQGVYLTQYAATILQNDIRNTYSFNGPGVGGVGSGFSGNVNNPFSKVLVSGDEGIAALIHNTGVHQVDGQVIRIPGAEGHGREGLITALGYQQAAYNFYESNSFTNFFPAPGDFAGISQTDRMKLAGNFDRGLSRADAISVQTRLLKMQGFDEKQTAALIKFREKIKFSDDYSANLAAIQGLIDAGLSGDQIPNINSAVWAFCFSGETEISMADGSKKRIDEIVAGDEVLAFSEFDEGGKGELVPRKVVRLFHELTDTWLKLSNGISVTPGHMFLTTDGTYEPISEILEKRGGEVVLEDGTVEVLTAELVEFNQENAELYPSGSKWVAETQGALALEPTQNQPVPFAA